MLSVERIGPQCRSRKILRPQFLRVVTEGRELFHPIATISMRVNIIHPVPGRCLWRIRGHPLLLLFEWRKVPFFSSKPPWPACCLPQYMGSDEVNHLSFRKSIGKRGLLGGLSIAFWAVKLFFKGKRMKRTAVYDPHFVFKDSRVRPRMTDSIGDLSNFQYLALVRPGMGIICCVYT